MSAHIFGFSNFSDFSVDWAQILSSYGVDLGFAQDAATYFAPFRGISVVEDDKGQEATTVFTTGLGDLYDDLIADGGDGFYRPDSELNAQYENYSFSEGRVLVEISSETPDALLDDLASLDFAVEAVGDFLVAGYIPFDSLAALENIDGIETVRGVQSVTFVGDATTQADAALETDFIRDNFGFDGTGVSIGILSDSFNALGGFMDDVASGDLPADVTILQDFTGPNATDEGRAIAQIIHDIAPGADLLFRTAFNGQADFAQGILDLAAAGADIIIDDIAYLAEPFFQDGIVAQAVDTVTAQGVQFYSAAGNEGSNGFVGSFDAGTVPVLEPSLNAPSHNWQGGSGASDPALSITIEEGETIQFVLQWDNPFFSVSGGTGATADLDLTLYAGGTTNLVASAADFNRRVDGGSGDPVEILTFTNTGPTADFDLFLSLFSGTAPARFQIVNFGDEVTINEHISFDGSTLIGHPNAAGAIAVGAAGFFDTPEFGTNPPQLQPFSALGGTPVFFDTSGNRLTTPEDRGGPAFVAVDGGNTTFFGQDIGFDTDSFPNFFGTSASSPAAAAFAALLVQANPNLTRDETVALLSSTAIDIGAPGVDLLSGAGLIQGDAAINQLFSGDDDILRGGSTVTARGDNDGLDLDTGTEAGADDLINGGAGDDLLGGGDGADILIGGEGDDEIDGGAGNDVARFSGNFADYTIVITNGIISVTDDVGQDGSDQISNVETLEFADQTLLAEEVLFNRIEGTTGDDALLNGTTGSDLILGLEGDDGLRGSVGADRIDGGSGIDGALYNGSNAGVIVTLTGSGDPAILGIGGHAEGDELIDIENILGSSFADTLTGNDEANEINGAAGDDILNGGGDTNTLIGGLGNDTFISSDGNNFFDGGAGGGDLIDYSGSFEGVDVGVNSGGSFSGGDAAGDSHRAVEHLTGSAFADTLTGNSLINILTGGDGDDVLSASANNDTLNGGDGDDLLIGSSGADIINGGVGLDTASYTNAPRRVVVDLDIGSGEGRATGSGHGVGDTLIGIENVTGSNFNDMITGDAGANVLDGRNGIDRIFGEDGDDMIFGRGGNDIINAGAGNDIIEGGAGVDRYNYDDADFGQDTIIGFFNNQERIDFRGSGLTFADLDIDNSSGDTVITVIGDPNNASITLQGITTVINQADFIF